MRLLGETRRLKAFMIVEVVVSASFTLLCVTLTAGTSFAAPSARELEKKAVDYRKAFKPGHEVVKVTNRVDRAAKPYESIIRTYDQIFDGPRVRSIVNWQFLKGNGKIKSRKTRTVIDGGMFIREFSEEFPVASWPAGSQRPEYSESIEPEKQEAWDPRLLGLIPSDVEVLSRESIDRDDGLFWYARGGPEPTVVADKVGSREAWRIDVPTEGIRQSSL